MIIDHNIITPDIKHILLFKVVPDEVFFDFTERLCTAYPGLKVTIIASTQDQDGIDAYRIKKYHPEIDDVIYFNISRFRRGLQRTLVRQVRRRRFKLLLVPFGSSAIHNHPLKLYLPYKLPVASGYFITSTGEYLPIDFLGIMEMLRKMLRLKGFWHFLWAKIGYLIHSSYSFGFPTRLYFDIGSLKMDDYKFIVESLDYPLNNVVYSAPNGAFSNPDIYKMTRYNKNQEIKTRVITNRADFDPDKLIEAGPEELGVIIDDYNDSEESRALLAEVLGKIKKIYDIKKKLGIVYPRVSVLVGGLLGDALEETREFLLNCEALFISAKREPEAEENPLCSFPWYSSCFSEKGDVFPCPFRREEKLGNIFDDDLKLIWNSMPYRRFRRRLIEDSHSLSGCKSCLHSGDKFDLM